MMHCRDNFCHGIATMCTCTNTFYEQSVTTTARNRTFHVLKFPNPFMTSYFKTFAHHDIPRYWEQLLDTGSGGLAASPIWDPVTGVGGNGTGPDSCIADGPFANLTLHMDNDGTVLNYCVSRSWNETVFQYANQTYVDRCFATQEYATAWECFHDAPGPHTAGHSATGGLVCIYNMILKL